MSAEQATGERARAMPGESSARSRRYAPAPGVAVTTVGADLVLHHPDSGAHVLDAAGRLVWESLDGRRRLGDVILGLQERFPQQDAQIDTDVVALVQQLRFAGLLVLISGEASTGPDDPAEAREGSYRTDLGSPRRST